MANEMIVRFPGQKQVNAQYGTFEICTDQPTEDGGQATAPQPFDLFLASLGTCAGFYVLSFCTKRGIPTTGIEIRQHWERDAQGKLSKILLEIRVPTSFPEKYHAALVRAADQCAVKKALQSPPLVETHTVVL